MLLALYDVFPEHSLVDFVFGPLPLCQNIHKRLSQAHMVLGSAPEAQACCSGKLPTLGLAIMCKHIQTCLVFQEKRLLRSYSISRDR